MAFGDKTVRTDITATLSMTMFHHPSQFQTPEAELLSMLEDIADIGENFELTVIKKEDPTPVQVIQDGPLAQMSESDRGILGILADHLSVSMETVSDALAKGSFRFRIS